MLIYFVHHAASSIQAKLTVRGERRQVEAAFEHLRERLARPRRDLERVGGPA